MKKGFTLIELLGVIIILALLVVLVFPSIVNSVRNSSKKTDDVTLQLIYNASNLYIDNHKNNFPRINGGKYIVDLADLIGEGHLVSPIKLSESDDDITNKKCVQVIYNNGFDYELKNYSECVIRLFDDVNVDINGDRKLTNEDPIVLSKYLASIYSSLEFDESIIKGATDMNKDGVFIAQDVNLLSESLGLVRTVPGLLGDVDGNGLINEEDRVMFQKYISEDNVVIVQQNSDINGDNHFNVFDASGLQTMIIGYSS